MPSVVSVSANEPDGAPPVPGTEATAALGREGVDASSKKRKRSRDDGDAKTAQDNSEPAAMVKDDDEEETAAKIRAFLRGRLKINDNPPMLTRQNRAASRREEANEQSDELVASSAERAKSEEMVEKAAQIVSGNPPRPRKIGEDEENAAKIRAFLWGRLMKNDNPAKSTQQNHAASRLATFDATKKPASKHSENDCFWHSEEAATLFGFVRGDDVREGIRYRIKLLKWANETDDGWKCLVPRDGREDSYPRREIRAVRHRALFLAKAYLVALEKMNEATWQDCCKEAETHLDGLGLVKLAGRTIEECNISFRVGNVFPRPAKLVYWPKFRGSG